MRLGNRASLCYMGVTPVGWVKQRTASSASVTASSWTYLLNRWFTTLAYYLKQIARGVVPLELTVEASPFVSSLGTIRLLSEVSKRSATKLVIAHLTAPSRMRLELHTNLKIIRKPRMEIGSAGSKVWVFIREHSYFTIFGMQWDIESSWWGDQLLSQ